MPVDEEIRTNVPIEQQTVTDKRQNERCHMIPLLIHSGGQNARIQLRVEVDKRLNMPTQRQKDAKKPQGDAKKLFSQSATANKCAETSKHKDDKRSVRVDDRTCDPRISDGVNKRQSDKSKVNDPTEKRLMEVLKNKTQSDDCKSKADDPPESKRRSLKVDEPQQRRPIKVNDRSLGSHRHYIRVSDRGANECHRKITNIECGNEISCQSKGVSDRSIGRVEKTIGNFRVVRSSDTLRSKSDTADILQRVNISSKDRQKIDCQSVRRISETITSQKVTTTDQSKLLNIKVQKIINNPENNTIAFKDCPLDENPSPTSQNEESVEYQNEIASVDGVRPILVF